jgi:hypothetical protein
VDSAVFEGDAKPSGLAVAAGSAADNSPQLQQPTYVEYDLLEPA